MIEKIRKLLALAESSNEHEAELALLNAQKLMVKHKLTMADVQDVQPEPVVQLETGTTYTVRTDGWVGALAHTIADNTCCITMVQRDSIRAQKRAIMFCGFESDAQTAAEMFRFAYNYAHTEADKIKRAMKRAGESARYATYEAQSYGLGFVDGLEAAFEEQKSRNEWGLILVVPDEVQAETRDLRKIPTKITASTQAASYGNGYSDGHAYGTQRRIAAATC